ncbi:MAG: hypothetical protein CL867_00570 [Cytophagaceae bacterium]|nr:hypothetical protein [Cytophagaceae bacterium]
MTSKHLQKSLLLTVFTIGLCTLLYGVYRFMETPKDTRDVTAVAHIEQGELLTILQTKVDSTFNQYLEKAITIESQITQIQYREGTYSLLLQGDQKDTFIICQMQPNQNRAVNNYKVGDTVTVKGVFKGFLKDAVLLNCIFLNEL